MSINKSKCIVSSKDQEVLMNGSRSKYNCYMLISQPSSKDKGMKDIIWEDVVKGFPKFMIKEGKTCIECQIGKQTKMSYKML